MEIQPIKPVYKPTFNTKQNPNQENKNNNKNNNNKKQKKNSNPAVILNISAEGRKKSEDYER